MNYIVLLDSDANTSESEREERSKFIRSILESLNIDLSFWDSEESSLSVANRIHLRKILSQYDINLIETPEGVAQIYFERKLIAEWRKPHYILKMDHSYVDPRKQLYLEMQVNFSSIFEDTECEKST